MMLGARWLAASSLLACLVCIAACGWLDQMVYVDEAGLLAGFSAPTFSAANVSRLPQWPLADRMAQQQWLVDRLDERDLLPQVHALRHSASCSCAAVSAVVHAGRGDGLEAVLLSTRFGGSSAAGEARSAATLVELGAQLATSSWLAKDVALLFVPCCACAAASEGAECAAAPLRRLLSGLTLQAALGTRAARARELPAEVSMARVGIIQQALSLSLGASGRPAALRALLSGHGGQLPNLDLYATVWKVPAPALAPEPRA